MPEFEDCLNGIFSQRCDWPFEVLVLDSGSSDGTVRCARAHDVRLIEIPREQFGHGKTRNLGADFALGEFLVFVVQDAIPVGLDWLRLLVAACEKDGVAAAFSRQTVAPDSDALVRWKHDQGYLPPTGDDPVVRQSEHFSTLDGRTRHQMAFFSNVSSCIRRDIWSKQPFKEVPYGEDVHWAERVLSQGEAIVYEPRSQVVHTHDRSAWYEMKRAYADNALVVELFGLVQAGSGLEAVKLSAWQTTSAWRAIIASGDSLAQKSLNLIRAPVHMIARSIGAYLGGRSNVPEGKRSGHFVDQVMRNS